MSFTREQKQEAYKKLSPEAQDFVMDNETTDLISKFLQEAGLSEEQSTSADSEVLYALLGIQTLSDAIDNIAKLSNKEVTGFGRLKTNLEDNIFSKLKTGETKEVPREAPREEVKDRKDNIGESFEQAIINQAKAMRTALPPDNLPTGMAHTTPVTVNPPPQNIPGKPDPYREPIQ